MSTPFRGILNAHQTLLSVAHRLLDLTVIVWVGYEVNEQQGTPMGAGLSAVRLSKVPSIRMRTRVC